MRHLWTLIAAVAIAPVGWVMLAYGQDRSIQAFLNEDASGAFSSGDFIRPVLCLGAAGLLLGLLGTLRFSPAGAVLTGLLYAGGYLAMLASPDTVLGIVPGRISLAGREADLETPLRTGSAMVLGAALLLAVASAGRWRRPAPARAEDADDRAPLSLERDRPLGADGLGLTPVPTSGSLFDVPGARAGDAGATARDGADATSASRWETAGARGGTGDAFRWDSGDDAAVSGWDGAGSGSGWGQGTPVTPGRFNERPEGAGYAPRGAGHWSERAREAGAEARRWPTVR